MQGQGFEMVSMRTRTTLVLCLTLLVMLQQVSASPVPSPNDGQSGSYQEVLSQSNQEVSVPKRVARMTPLWRIMGTKPLGAYCQGNYECSTGICRGSHCAFSQPIKSKRAASPGEASNPPSPL